MCILSLIAIFYGLSPGLCENGFSFEFFWGGDYNNLEKGDCFSLTRLKFKFPHVLKVI